MELWKIIEEFPNYIVSDKGRIACLNSRTIVNNYYYSYGYKNINLYNEDNKPHSKRVHRLVATAFCPNPNNYRCVKYIDDDKSNLCADNLEWVLSPNFMTIKINK